MLTREQILEVDTYCAEHQVSQQRYLDDHNIPRHQYYEGSIVRKTNSPLSLELLFSYVLVVSLSHP